MGLRLQPAGKFIRNSNALVINIRETLTEIWDSSLPVRLHTGLILH